MFKAGDRVRVYRRLVCFWRLAYFVRYQGQQLALVRFDGERHARNVYTADLKPVGILDQLAEV